MEYIITLYDLQENTILEKLFRMFMIYLYIIELNKIYNKTQLI